ncbi:Hypothetical protein R9X50_00651100 [Acrodontium crateriforme]|uniref:Probable glucan endo-1,3-beta-glucosidase eglC n=1 Tax=Acrodontium crateriforme TaxID=150365 RepID=A0AAQ3RDN2_9PEZI|nr:Hypothetical protein R9X50_00651100 [Acrodontium crateriforme]
MQFSTLLAAASAIVSAQATYSGFNYGSTFTTGAAKGEADFKAEFERAKSLAGTNSEFTSARLYTMIQAGTTNTPISAIQAAIDTKTTLLLGLWASAGQGAIDNEIAALTAAIKQYGETFTSLIAGISVGSEDLYRITPTGIQNKENPGADPSVLVSYIQQVRAAIKDTSASKAPIGHVDTWTAWVNGSNADVISNCDWIGMDAYPYFQKTIDNGIDVGKNTFFAALDATKGVSQGKEVWVTETGWPVSGPNSNLAVASIDNAEIYWKEVACSLLGNTNTFWFTLQDAAPQTPSPSFGIIGSDLSSAPLYDLSCSGAKPSSSASSSASASSATAQKSTSAVASSSVAPATSSAVLTSAYPSDCPTKVTKTVYVTASESASTMTTVVSSSTAAGSKTCPTGLSGEYQYPHLIIPVSSEQPNKAWGTQYNGNVKPNEDTIFNFDIPASYAGKTCSLIFDFPEKKDLETSDYTWNNKGGLKIEQCAAPATQSTTWANKPASNGQVGVIPSLSAGNGYVVATGPCKAGERIAYEFSSTGGLDLEWFNDYNPSPLGVFITTC